MGYAIAETAYLAGADVTLISGPVNLSCSDGIELIKVSDADEMYQNAVKNFEKADIAIMTAAVADYTPIEKFSGKLKKETLGDNPTITLRKTKDILAELGSQKKAGQILVGFALESDNVIENAKIKFEKKNCDLIIANQAGKELSGFGGDFNTISVIGKNSISDYLPMSKKDCSEVILSHIDKLLSSSNISSQ